MVRSVVVGGGAAGMSAASVAKRRDPDRDVTVLEAGQRISFAACGMPYWIGDVIEGPEERLVAVNPREAREERGLDVRLGTRVTDVDADAREVTAEGPEGAVEIPYDDLVIATGAEAVVPMDGGDLEGVHALRHLDDGVRLKHALEATAPDRVCVVGGGFVGLEVVEGLLARDVDVTLVHSHDALLTGMLDPGMGALVTDAVRERDVDLVLGAHADRIVGDGDGRVAAVEAGSERVPCGMVVVGVGARPRTQVAEAAGASLGETGAIAVDRKMRTDVDRVWACGDGVELPHRVTGEPTFLPLALHANRTGRIVGENVAGGDEAFPGVLGTAVTRFEGTEVGATGLTLEAAGEAGFDAVQRTITSSTRAGYFPGAAEVQVRLVVEAGSGRLLGGQIVGGAGAAKRIDTVAAAMWTGATADDLEAMDLAYAPPFSPVWDPVAIAARLAGRRA